MTSSPASDKVPLSTLLIFSSPVLAGTLLQGPVGYLPGVFAKYFDLNLMALGAFFSIARLFDAVTDPIMGYVSDNVKTRFGRRKPWIGLGTGLTLVFGFLLFFPVTQMTAFYFGVTYSLLTLAQTISGIPHTAWGACLSRDYIERNRVFYYISMAQLIGSFIFLAMPLAPFFDTTALTPAVLQLMFVVGGAMSVICVFVLLKRVPEPEDVATEGTAFSLRALFRLLKDNPPLLYFIVMSFVSAIGLGCYVSLGFIYFDTYLKIGDKISAIGMLSTIASLAAFPLWIQLAKRLDKRHVYILGAAGYVVALIPFVFLTPTPNVFWYYIGFSMLHAAISTGRGFMIPSIKSDIVDYGVWKTGAECAGTYMSFTNLLTKVEFSLAAGLAFIILGAFGYEAAAETQTATAILGLKFTHLILPMVMVGTAALMMLWFPITRRRQEIIRKQLERRAKRNQSQAAAST